MEMDLQEILSYSAITGHISYDDIKNKLGNDLLNEYILCSIVRDPIDRTISLWNYILQNSDLPDHKNVSKMTFEEFVAQRTFNDQCYYIAQNRDAATAIEHIHSDFDFLVTLLDYKCLLEKICSIFNHDPSDFKIENKSFKWISREILKQAVLDSILKRNRQDQILYEHIRDHPIGF